MDISVYAYALATSEFICPKLVDNKTKTKQNLTVHSEKGETQKSSLQNFQSGAKFTARGIIKQTENRPKILRVASSVVVNKLC